MDAFINCVEDFKSRAIDTDRRVALRITSDKKSFICSNDISVSVSSYIGAQLKQMAKGWIGNKAVGELEEWGRGLKYSIKDWYSNGGKYALEIAGDILKVVLEIAAVLAVSSKGIGAILVGAFGVYCATPELIYDIEASDSYMQNGDRAVADRLEKKAAK